MANIASSTFGGELKSYQDYLFKAEATPANTSTVSAVKELGRSQDGLEIVVEVTTEINIADTKVLTITYAYDDDAAGSFSDSVTIYSMTASGATALPVGELARIVPSREWGTFGKVTVTTNDATADGAFSIYPVAVN